MPAFSQSPFNPWLRLLLGALGAAALGGGTAAVFLTTNGTGTGVLIALGGTVLVLALLGDGIESVEFGTARLKMRAAAAENFALAEQSDRQGDSITAARLRAEAYALLEAAGSIASDYRAVRGSMAAGRARTMAMERVVARARQLAAEQPFEHSEVVRWLQHGTDEERITALGMMQAKPELRDFHSVLATIKDSRSAFEQYHAMLLAEKMIADLSTQDKQRLIEVIESVKGRRFKRDTDRWRLSERILGTMGRGPDDE